MTEDITEKSTLLKKYLLKRQRLREEPLPLRSNIFRMASEQEEGPEQDIGWTNKYQTLSTNVDNSMTMQFSNMEPIILPSRSVRQGPKRTLPSISIILKRSQVDISHKKNLETEFSSLKTRPRELFRHISDPFHIRLEKTNCPRTLQKHNKYQNGWLRATQKRRGKSLMERSLQKAAQSIGRTNEDADKRRNSTKLEELLRNNIEEKTFVHPAWLRPDLKGIKGVGGKAVPLFDEIRVIEQVLKHHKGSS